MSAFKQFLNYAANPLLWPYTTNTVTLDGQMIETYSAKELQIPHMYGFQCEKQRQRLVEMCIQQIFILAFRVRTALNRPAAGLLAVVATKNKTNFFVPLLLHSFVIY